MSFLGELEFILNYQLTDKISELFKWYESFNFYLIQPLGYFLELARIVCPFAEYITFPLKTPILFREITGFTGWCSLHRSASKRTAFRSTYLPHRICMFDSGRMRIISRRRYFIWNITPCGRWISEAYWRFLLVNIWIICIPPDNLLRRRWIWLGILIGW